MTILYTDSPTNRSSLCAWQEDFLKKFELKMSDVENPFPCIPAKIGFATNQLRYGFVGNPREESSLLKLAQILKTYTEESIHIGNYTSLIVFYQLPKDMMETYNVKDYEYLFWKQLAQLASVDGIKWPEEIPMEPHDSRWEYCFHGERYFMYCATPAHQNRQSRYFVTLMLAITPRWVLETFNKMEKQASKIKKSIRERINNYDVVSVHPDLNSYGDVDNYEWKQYFLRDDNTTLSKCPFRLFFDDD